MHGLKFTIGLLAIIFAAEALVMFILPFIFPADVPVWLEAVADATLLTVLAVGPIRCLLCRSLLRSYQKLATAEIRLEDRLEFTQAIIAASLEAVVSIDEHNIITFWNPQAEALFGWRADEAVGRRLTETIIPERYRAAHEAALRRFLQTGRGRLLGQRIELVAQHRDAYEFPVEVSLSAGRSSSGFVFTAFIRDIRERKRNEEQLRKLSRVVEQTASPVIITDSEGRIEFVNEAFTAASGYSAEEVIGKNPRILKSGLTPRETFDAMWKALTAGRVWRGELCNRRKNGELYWILATTSPLQDSAGRTTHYVGVQEDITARKQMEEELRLAARTDRLTGLINRGLFCDRLEQALLRRRRHRDYHFAVLFLDLDRFKLVNDTFGHEAGDRLLVEVAERLRSAVRCNDSISRHTRGHSAARFGGDEFVLLLDGITGPEDAAGVAERLLNVLSQPFRIGQAEVEVFTPASIGIVTSAMPAESAEEILRNADIALYEAKLRGKGRYVMFDHSMHDRVQRRVNLENDLRQAIAAGQLFLMYQPIVSLETGALESMEALIRWNHPQRGAIAPHEFIPIAEETGLILPIGEWTLRQACRQWSEWQNRLGELAPRTVSINLSRCQLALENLPRTVQRILEETGASPSGVHLEITESAAMTDPALARRVLQALKQIGVGLCLDDFGTGQSSLWCLHDFPIDVLKIDRSFIANLSRGRDYLALIHAANQLAHNLNMRVVAEGIESPDQIAALVAVGCEYGQGYLLGRPLTGAQVEEFILSRGGAAGLSAFVPDSGRARLLSAPPAACELEAQHAPQHAG
jgi:diguanylate cyclase (GGDEF)-like protein/PAS domain S-box-containing protein